MHLRIAALLSFIALVACKSDSPSPTADEAESGPTVPKIAVDQPVFDFGSVKPTDRIDHVFEIENVGTADLQIKRVHSTDDSTTIAWSEVDVLPPGEKVDIAVNFRTTGDHGDIATIVAHVETNDPEQPDLALKMRGKVVWDVYADPGYFLMFDLPLNTPETRTFKLALDTNVKVESVTIGRPAKFEVVKLEGDSTGNGTYEVRYHGRDSVGYDHTEVIIKTTSEDSPEVVIPIRTSTVLPLKYDDQVYFDYPEDGVQDMVFEISALRGDAPRIKRVVDPDRLLEIDVLEPTGPTANVRLTIRESKLLKIPFEARIAWHPLIVHTSDEQVPKLELQYKVGLGGLR